MFKINYKVLKIFTKLFGTTLCAQILLFLSTPILTHFYSSDQYGEYAIFASAYGILILFSTFKIDQGITISESEETAISLTIVCIVLSIVTAITAIGFFHLLNKILHGRIKDFQISFLSISLILGAITSCIQQWATRKGDLKVHSKILITNTIITITFSILLGITNAKNITNGLVASFTTGQFLTILLHFTFTPIKLSFRKNFSQKNYSEELIKYIYLPKYIFPGSLLQSIGPNIIPLILSSQLGTSAAGVFSIANRIIITPFSIVGSTISQIFITNLTNDIRQSKINADKIKKLILILTSITIIAVAILWSQIESIIQLALGPSYVDASKIGKLLLIAAGCTLILQPFNNIFSLIKKIKLFLLQTAIVSAIPTLLLFIGATYGNIKTSAIFYSIGYAITTLIIIILIFNTTFKNDCCVD